jgi:hypothetical protein
MYRFLIVAVLMALLGACASNETGRYGMSGSSSTRYAVNAPPMDPTRKIDEQDCSRPIQPERGNLLCK